MLLTNASRSQLSEVTITFPSLRSSLPADTLKTTSYAFSPSCITLVSSTCGPSAASAAPIRLVTLRPEIVVELQAILCISLFLCSLDWD